MTNKLVWRLGKLPTVEELLYLVKDKVITQEEAKEVLFSSETEESRDRKSLEAEIKFLREIVEKLSSDRSRIVETIKVVERPFEKYPWYEPYRTWCMSDSINSPTYTTYTNSDIVLNTSSVATNTSFKDIKTF